MLKTKSCFSVTLVFLLFGVPSTACLSKETDRYTVLGNLNSGSMADDVLRPRMIKALVADSDTKHQPAAWIKGIRRSHTFSNVSVICPSGDAQFDFDCLQAFCGVDAGTENDRFYSTGFDVDATEDIFARKERKEFRETHHILDKPNVLLYYKIPLDVANRFEMLFSKSELCGAFNMGMIENPSIEKLSPKTASKLIELYVENWPKFYSTHGSPTKADFLEHAKNLSI